MFTLLVAGIGNIFMGDDGFGVEVARRLAKCTMPSGVHVGDYGIRAIDLTYALLDQYDAAILIDTIDRGGEPGTLYVIEPEPDASGEMSESLMLSPHELDPDKMLRMVTAMKGRCRKILMVACEPLTFGDEFEGKIGLSDPVSSAVEPAMAMVESLVHEWMSQNRTSQTFSTSNTPGGVL